MTILQSSIVPSSGYQISRSLRFNSADSAYLNRTPASAGNRQKWTISVWHKRSTISTAQMIISAWTGTSTQLTNLQINSDNTITYYYDDGSNNYRFTTTQVFRDVSSWYHFVLAVDTTQATNSNRARFYVNGSEVTAFSQYDTFPQNSNTYMNAANAHNIGRYLFSSDRFLNGYLTEFNLIDGQQLTPSSFGQTNASTGVWEPVKYTGTYGTNGFYLNFSDNSNTTAATLGKDYSGNGNNWTPNNFSVTAGAGNDSLVDTPTSYGSDTGVGGEVRGNYCTLNPLDSGVTVVNGNLDFVYVAANRSVLGTVGMRTGKFRWEFTPSAANNNFELLAGVIRSTSSFNKNANECRFNAGAYSVAGLYGGSTLVRPVNNNTFGTSFGWTWTNGDVLGLYFDATNGTLKANQNGGSLVTVYTGLTTGIDWLPVFSDGSISSATHVTNFGQRPFAYASAESGYQALCTQNLPTPTIGATSTTQAGKYFNPVLYTGNGSTQSITGVGFQPDFVWIKNRGTATDHGLFDAIRGTTKRLSSNLTNAETTEVNSLTAFNSDGFSVGATQDFNQNTVGIVAWNWKANGAGSSNTAGTITSTVSANTTAGFSIVTYTGNNSTATIGHGLGVAPSMIIIKDRLQGTGYNWNVYHASIGNTQRIYLDATSAATTGVWNNTSPTSTVFTVINNAAVNGTDNYVAYCWTPIAGYSAFGSYTGNGSSDGPFVYTGFRPRYVMVKRTDSADSWQVWDTARDPYNVTSANLYPNLSNAEVTDSSQGIDIVSNGFKLRTSNVRLNASGGTYIFITFASNPFKYSLGA